MTYEEYAEGFRRRVELDLKGLAEKKGEIVRCHCLSALQDWLDLQVWPGKKVQ